MSGMSRPDLDGHGHGVSSAAAAAVALEPISLSSSSSTSSAMPSSSAMSASSASASASPFTSPSLSSASQLHGSGSGSDALHHKLALAVASPSAAALASAATLSALVSTLEQTTAAWTAFQLDQRRREIDAQAMAMYDEEERSVQARKGLAESTKNLKKSPNDVKLSLLGGVLKSYQEEINQLTRRSKTAETSFLTLYKALFDAPDPAPYLRAHAAQQQRCATLESELRDANARLLEYDAEFQSLKNQDVKIRRLEAEKKQLELTLDQRLQDAEAQLQVQFQTQLQELQQRVQEREQLHLQQSRGSLSDVLTTHEQAQELLFQQRQRFDEERERYEKDLELLRQELERAQSVSMKLTTELNDVNAQRSALDSFEEQRDALLSPNSKTSLADLEDELVVLRERLDDADRMNAREHQDKHDLANRLEGAERVLQRSTEAWEDERRVMQVRMQQMVSREEYERLERQLQAWQEIESGGDGDSSSSSSNTDSGSAYDTSIVGERASGDVGAAAAAEAKAAAEAEAAAAEAAASVAVVTAAASSTPSSTAGASLSAMSPVERALLKKVKKYEAELTSLKLELNEQRFKCTSLDLDLTTLKEQLAASKQLAQRLEDDLARANTFVSTHASAASAASAAASAHHADGSGTPAGSAHVIGGLGGDSATRSRSGTANAIPSNSTTNVTGATTSLSSSSSHATDPSSAGGLQSSTSSAPSSSLLGSPSVDSSTSSSSSSTDLAASSMLAIIVGQRDRFRARMEELEREKSEVTARAQRLSVELERLKQDNVELYEKLRFVRSYEQRPSSSSPDLESGGRVRNGFSSSSSSSSSSSAWPSWSSFGGQWNMLHSNNSNSSSNGASDTVNRLPPPSSSSSSSGSSDTESRYAELYEEKVNPFNAFKKKALMERERLLPPSERATLFLTRLVASKKAARSFVFFYALVLHLLVFAVLWTHTIQDHCSEVHTIAAHGGGIVGGGGGAPPSLRW